MATVTIQGNAVDVDECAGNAGDSSKMTMGDRTGVDISDEVYVRLVELEATFALRKAVLRPWLTHEMCHDMYGGDGEHFNVGAFVSGSSSSAARCVCSFARHLNIIQHMFIFIFLLKI